MERSDHAMKRSDHAMKRSAPAAERNRGPILDVLRGVLPATGLVLEIASGTGQHVVHFAAALPRLEFQPSDVDDDNLASVRAWIAETGLTNVRPPIRLDVRDPVWPVARADALFCANMIHIAPWAAAEGLLAGAGRVLPPGGVLCLYGPFAFGGRFLAPSNEAFDASLRARDPAWGVRDLDVVTATAAGHGLVREALFEMPANNHVVVFRRSP
jgi:SAM-dependent methyltransferase